MTIKQLLRIILARWWLVVGFLVVATLIGVPYALTRPKQFTAEASLIVEGRMDPTLGSVSPGLGSASYMATQVDILRSERVASRVVKMLGVERTPSAVAQWREATNAKIPLERYFAGLLQRGLSVEPGRGSSLINLSYSSPDPVFAQAAANAFAQAYMDVSVELRIAPTRQSTAFLEEQSKTLRANLEAAQARLSKFQQDKGIVVSDASFDQENARYQALVSQLSAAQSERVDSNTRLRNSGSLVSPDIQTSSSVQSLRSQLAAAETKLTELSATVGKNHPLRIQADAQIAELKQQIAAESRIVSGGTSTVNRSTGQKIAELQGLVEDQRQKLMTLRADRDQVAVISRDVDTAKRAYDDVMTRLSVFTLSSVDNQANTRLLSAAVEPLDPNRQRVALGILGSIGGGLVIGVLAALGWELLDRRVRDPEDLMVMTSVPVLGVLRPEGSKRPVFRRLLQGGPAPLGRQLLSAPGMQT